MFRHTTWALFASSCTLLALACYAPTTHAGGWGVFTKPTTDVDRLATQIDKLERHLEEYGSVVPKTPDVWGEARLTKYRKVVEKELARRENQFSPTINGAISRSDQAFLASTMALQAAVSGRSAVMTTPISNVITSTTSAGVSRTRTDQITQERIGIPGEGVISEQPEADTERPETERVFETVEGTAVNFGTSTTISLEPTLDLNQRFRYLQHLNEFRRINDGDDTSDSPGYALHLIRIPVSILPGRKTEEGYGAEVTITAKPHLHEKLLPMTFKQLVINDIVDQLAFPLAKFIDSPKGQKALDKLDEISRISDNANSTVNKNKNPENTSMETSKDLYQPGTYSKGGIYIPTDEEIQTFSNAQKSNFRTFINLPTDANFDEIDISKQVINIDAERQIALDELNDVLKDIVGSISVQPFRRSTLPIPSSRLLEIYGLNNSRYLYNFFKRLKAGDLHKNAVVTLDLQKLIQEEVTASYDFLLHNQDLWMYVTPKLAADVHGHDYISVEETRSNFFTAANQQITHSNPALADIPVLPLAWGIIVESALLTERLTDDMNETAAAKDCQCLNRDWLPYFLPNPPPEAIHNFNEYVRCRWPVHVFAVDPITEDQNIADSFAQRREMQLALSMAFTSGRMSAQKFLRYARQTSLDVDTIALNRTVVGFSHGDDTFGWRFYPRVQTPRTPGNATVVFRDMLYGGLTQDQLLCQRRLEPGQRECTALVIMPSFVPYCTFDMRSNWFKLTNAKKKELDLRDGVGISREIVALKQMSAQCTKQAHLYRAEDLNHLTRTVEQLERRLPLQTSYVQIPYENTLGGFEFFNTGVTDLAPELKGFYGEPGIDTSKDTTIFVVGDHFSIHETQVIAGNQGSPLTGKNAVPANDVRFELLSRQIMRVTIPANTHTYTTEDSSGKPLQLVDLHVATPYGVSNHLSIPVIKSAAQTQAKAAADAAKAEVAKALVASGISYKWKQDDPINATYCTNNSALSINFSNSDIDPTTTRQIISDSPQSSIFDPTPEPQLAVIVTGLDADGNAIPGQQWTYTPEFVHDPVTQSGPIAFELSVSAAGGPGSPLTLTLPTRKILQNIQASLAGSVLTPQAPAALHLQGYLRFGGDGAPIMALSNNLLIRLSPINCSPPCIPGTTSNLNSLFTPVATSPPQPSLPLANSPQLKPSLADRYRIPQQATITPPLIAQ